MSKTRSTPTCDHCRKPCTKGVVRNADGVWCSPKHHVAAMQLRAVAVDAELEAVDVAGAITTALARRGGEVVSWPSAAMPASTHDAILARWFESKSPDTVRSYTGHLQHFARWAVGHDPGRFRGTPIAVVLTLLRLPSDEANDLVQRWINSQSAGGKSGPKRAATGITARYRALRSLAKMLKRDGHVSDAKPPKVEKRTAFETRERYRGVPEAFGRIFSSLRALATKKDAKPIDVRDWMIFGFGVGLGLRRIEVVNIDIEHLRHHMAWVHGKGRRDREPRPMPPPLEKDLRIWLAVRKKSGGMTGPLFIGMHAKEGHRLTRDAINKMVMRRSRQFRARLAPHDIRRIFCTDAIKMFGIYGALVHTRHANVDTLGRYDLSAGEHAEAEAAQLYAAIAKRGTKHTTKGRQR